MVVFVWFFTNVFVAEKVVRVSMAVCLGGDESVHACLKEQRTVGRFVL